MCLKNYVCFSFSLIVIFIYAFNVQLSNCENEWHDKRDTDEDPGAIAEESGAVPGDIMATLAKLMEVPPMPFITVSVPLVFEGVDYDLLKNLSTKIYDDYYDCFYWHTRCIRDGTYFHTVCAYHNSQYWVNFANICQLELENCRHRVRNETWKPYEGIFGNVDRHYYDYEYIHFYHGDGHDCKYFKFRRHVPDDRVNFYYEDEQDAIEMEGYYNGNPMTKYYG